MNNLWLEWVPVTSVCVCVCVCVCVLVPVHVDDIIFHMFQYITKLRTEGPQEWVFQECKVGGEVVSAWASPSS